MHENLPLLMPTQASETERSKYDLKMGTCLAGLVQVRSKYFKTSCRPAIELGLWPSGNVHVVM